MRLDVMSDSNQTTSEAKIFVPHGDHVVVHLLQLGLGGVERVRGRVKFVCLEALVGEADLEGLVILLQPVNNPSTLLLNASQARGVLFRCVAYLRYALGVRRSGVGGYGSEGGSRSGGSENIAPERRRNVPPDGPGQHVDNGAEEKKRRAEVVEGGWRECWVSKVLAMDVESSRRCWSPPRPLIPRDSCHPTAQNH